MKQDPSIKIKEVIIDSLLKSFGESIDISLDMIVRPPDISMGDFSLPCFGLAKSMKVSPNQVAIIISEKFIDIDLFSEVRAFGPYCNFFVNAKKWNESVLGYDFDVEIIPEKKDSIMIEYSGPNPCKTFHVGHVRNTILGSAMINLYRYVGHEVMPVNYLNDTGTHVAKVMWLYNRSYKNSEPAIRRGAWLGDLYVEANDLLRDNAELMEEVYAQHRLLEANDPDARRLLELFKAWSQEEFDRIYSLLSAEFSMYFYDSDYINSGKNIIVQLLEKGIAKHSDGAVIVDLEQFGLNTALILKRDGSALYITKDLAMAKDRLAKFDVDRLMYVVGAEQILHFKQIFKILELDGFDRAKDCIHLSYELVNASSGKKMSTRDGTVVLFDDLYDSAYFHMLEQTKQHHPDWSGSDCEQTALILALSAIKFDMLKVDPQKSINFSMDSALDISGDTGPYILYTIARINSIIAKTSHLSSCMYELLIEDEERTLISIISRLNDIILQAISQNKPSILAHYSLELAREVNRFYQEHSVLGANNPNLISARVVLLKRCGQTLRFVLDLLNISYVEKM